MNLSPECGSVSPVSQNTNDLRSFFGDEDEEEAQLGVTFIIYKVLCLGKRENRHLLAPGEIMTTTIGRPGTWNKRTERKTSRGMHIGAK